MRVVGIIEGLEMDETKTHKKTESKIIFEIYTVLERKRDNFTTVHDA